MQVYIYICWQLELSGNANLRLYQCWFAFTHRSPIKNFASCRLREKNFASLRLRKNMVELRARLSLLVDKTTFQYRALTIYYTTIGRHAPAITTTTTTSASSRGGKCPHWTRPYHYQHPRHRGRMGRTGPAGSPQCPPPCLTEWEAPDVLDHTSMHPRRPQRTGRKGRS